MLHSTGMLVVVLGILVGMFVACVPFGIFSTPVKETPVAYYIPAATFKGPRRGYVFTTRDDNTGYYRDNPPSHDRVS